MTKTIVVVNFITLKTLTMILMWLYYMLGKKKSFVPLSIPIEKGCLSVLLFVLCSLNTPKWPNLFSWINLWEYILFICLHQSSKAIGCLFANFSKRGDLNELRCYFLNWPYCLCLHSLIFILHFTFNLQYLHFHLNLINRYQNIFVF